MGHTNSQSQEVYVKGLDDVFILAAILTCLSIPLTLFLEEKGTKRKKTRMGEEVTKGM